MIWLGKKRDYLQDWITQVWVKTTGRRFRADKDAWLAGPSGDTDSIKDAYINRLCIQENLRTEKNLPGFGLITSLDEWGLSNEEQQQLNPAVKDFYLHTYDYSFTITSRWNGVFYPFGWLIQALFSKRLQQLNLPLKAADTQGGVQSNIIKLYPEDSPVARYVIWYRTLKDKGTVVFSGIYGNTFVENEGRTCLKIIFPLPNGNATVILGIKVNKDGSLLLTSKGKKHGDPGFYFIVNDVKGKGWIKYVKAMHESLEVFADAQNALKATHRFMFYGVTFMTLEYVMGKK